MSQETKVARSSKIGWLLLALIVGLAVMLVLSTAFSEEVDAKKKRRGGGGVATFALNADKVDGSDAPLWAYVDGTQPTPVLKQNKGVTGVTRHELAPIGSYVLTFEKDISNCVVTVTPEFNLSYGAEHHSNIVNVAFFSTLSSEGNAPRDTPFNVVVNC